MEIEKSGLKVGATDDGTLRPAESITTDEESSADSRIPNPRPLKMTKTESSNPSPVVPSSEAVVDKTLEEKKKTTSRLFVIPSGAPKGSIEIPKFHPYCDICGRDHVPSGCNYWTKIPHGVKPVNESRYGIACECGEIVVDGRCSSSYCVGWKPRYVYSKYRLDHRLQFLA